MAKAKHRIIKIMINEYTFAGRHHQLKFLLGLVALDHRSSAWLYNTEHTNRTFGNTFFIGNLPGKFLLIDTAASQITLLDTRLIRTKFTAFSYHSRHNL